MNKSIYSIFLVVFAVCFIQCKGQTETANENYVFKPGSFDGTGKWYKGREISHVMGYQGINWLERPEREKEENTSRLIENMNILSGDTISDIGAGSGYHVFKIAPLAKDGLVYAVDIQPKMLQAIRESKKKEKVDNIKIIKGSEKSVNLPANSVDKMLLVDVYHEFSYPVEMLTSMHSALRNDGEIYLVEYRGEDASIPIKKLHKMTEAQAVKEFKANGFRLKENIANLPWQHCMIFVKD
ncbi:class I SAM-dependent methyltransferase [Christiangramia sabulilitoris]|uniref:Class I SAM-dependent methyltransferase n=1 Tax=Christiangramia sabulilitoris TaxID=2583991 RepID=A0A550I7N3_9FLAO|nr:class I SAM-dependent methyltransferase [Christiangramia sabulilitoris]TRO66983.1 class I SAM-dependent methyltransferase [Christiangramia sabulilitoris]